VVAPQPRRFVAPTPCADANREFAAVRDWHLSMLGLAAALQSAEEAGPVQ
jgi:hypothetical protein